VQEDAESGLWSTLGVQDRATREEENRQIDRSRHLASRKQDGSGMKAGWKQDGSGMEAGWKQDGSEMEAGWKRGNGGEGVDLSAMLTWSDEIFALTSSPGDSENVWPTDSADQSRHRMWRVRAYYREAFHSLWWTVPGR
jgi:hypothetical protein